MDRAGWHATSSRKNRSIHACINALRPVENIVAIPPVAASSKIRPVPSLEQTNRPRIRGNARAGAHLPRRCGDTPVRGRYVVCRAEDRSIHAFINRCAHRGSLVVRELRGNAKDFMCVYHHWLYNLKGELLGVPFERGVGGKGGMPREFDKANHGLQMLRVETHKEAIFGTFSDEVDDLDDYLGKDICAGLDRIFCKPIVVLGHMRQRFPSNWKAYLENLNDGFHGGLLHQLPVVFGLHRATQEGEFLLDPYARHSAAYVLFNSDTEQDIHDGYDDDILGAQAEDPLILADPQFLNYRDELVISIRSPRRRCSPTCSSRSSPTSS